MKVQQLLIDSVKPEYRYVVRVYISGFKNAEELTRDDFEYATRVAYGRVYQFGYFTVNKKIYIDIEFNCGINAAELEKRKPKFETKCNEMNSHFIPTLHSDPKVQAALVAKMADLTFEWEEI